MTYRELVKLCDPEWDIESGCPSNHFEGATEPPECDYSDVMCCNRCWGREVELSVNVHEYLTNSLIERKFQKEQAYSEGFSSGYAACLIDNEKYRWHDLKKNPDDLPPSCEIVLLYIEYFCYGEYNRLWRTYTVGDWFDFNFHADGFSKFKTLAWKYIEPFRGVE